MFCLFVCYLLFVLKMVKAKKFDHCFSLPINGKKLKNYKSE